VRFEILVLDGNEYRAVVPGGQPQVSVTLARAFELTRRRNRVGRWSYRLSAT
jgi:hypothetical protein